MRMLEKPKGGYRFAKLTGGEWMRLDLSEATVREVVNVERAEWDQFLPDGPVPRAVAEMMVGRAYQHMLRYLAKIEGGYDDDLRYMEAFCFELSARVSSHDPRTDVPNEDDDDRRYRAAYQRTILALKSVA